ncbi:MAG TPA: DUF2207 domain-containing protein, partial [Bacteroidia bacterium]|nr:DUF2207 domain-containing protein [Bacteroidia bacterium]
MKNHLALVCRGCCWALALMLLATNLHGQGWKVKQFSATIDLNEDGSFNVREQITVDFTESKRGIIRKLPYRYTQTNVEGEVAAGHSAGEDYLTPIVDIGVADWTYSVTKTRSAHEIKVGQSDVFLTGEQTYLIDYKVYGAINFFKNSQELYWNVNGNEWDVPFDNIDVTVNLPKKLKMSSDDVLAFTGVIGSTFNTSATTIEPGKVRVAATRRLEAKEGLTIVLRLPKGFLQQTPIPLSVRAENFVIDSLLTTMTLLEGGQIDVEERIVLNVVVTGADFVRTLEKNYYGPNVGGIPARALHYETKDSWIRQRNRTEFEVTETVKGYEADASNFQINISAPNFNETGRHVLRLHYTLWGATQPGVNGTAVYLPWLNPGDHEPVAYARVDLRWSGAMKIDMKDALLKDTAPPKGVVTMDANFLRMEFAAPLESSEKVHLGRYFPGRKVKVAAMPLHVFSPDEYFQFYDVDLEIQPNGNIHVVNKFALYRYSWYNRLNRPLTMEYSAYGNRSYTAGRPQSWGRMGKYLVRNLEFEGELVEYDTYTDHRLELWGPKMLKYNGFDTLQYSYDIFGVLASEGGGHRLNFPLVETIDALADRIHFRIRFPGGKVLSPKDISVATSTSLGLAAPFKDGVDMALSFKPGEVSGEIPQGMYSFNELDVNLRIPDGAVAGSFWVSLRLLWINHKALFLPLFFFIPLFIAWFFYGRDKGFTTVVEFYPPEELTSAEAGLLMDDHLHNRDILSLIYYWGAQGCISIQEIYDKSGKATDYKLSKLKKLPKTARKYEKTIFDGLFARGDSTKVSSQKQKFYTYINQARTQINAHAKAKNFYVPGTMG